MREFVAARPHDTHDDALNEERLRTGVVLHLGDRHFDRATAVCRQVVGIVLRLQSQFSVYRTKDDTRSASRASRVMFRRMMDESDGTAVFGREPRAEVHDIG